MRLTIHELFKILGIKGGETLYIVKGDMEFEFKDDSGALTFDK